ncbi:MAG: hypothetical protein NTY01_09310 [Verrucomicrobia bacterium]|nr:hypothetical protein [Verrucomicrobiota bacterium]
MMAFRNPVNGYQETADNPWLGALCFGPFYFMIKGVWTHAILGAVLALASGGLSWLFVYPFCANGIVKRHYLRKGWTQVQ